ncbi:helix-turn-helix domain-containing protein [Actinomadura scrupuli]|uniref:helix-turn-helix domain-containing protein n=1 Tax=Actinomadura scrupuli TaxID=559629 RepID=UPI003D984EEA
MAGRPKPLTGGGSGLAVFGSMLRMYRQAAGLNITQFGTKINYSASTISETEHGKSRCDRLLAERADAALGTGEALTHLWDLLVKAIVYPKWFDWPAYEARAEVLRSFEPTVIHGLLQTDEYARALLYGDEAAVAARMSRQDILTRQDPPPPLLVCVISRNASYQQIGSREVMRGQLDHLMDSISDRISVQVVPNGVVHPGIRGMFILATLDDGSDIGYLETAARGITTGAREDIRTLSESFEKIRSRALPVDQSLEVIRRIREEQWT